MTSTSDLVAAATVGTAHRFVDVAAMPEAVRPVPLPEESAIALLEAAALSALVHRTIPPTVPRPTGSPTLPAPERVPVIPDVVRQVLGRVNSEPAILIEALTLIHRAGLRLPPGLLPGLLDDPRPAVVAAAREVSGEIGGFLMRKNPRWTPQGSTDPADRFAWAQGTAAERTAWLRALRRADPAAARNLLTDDLDRETAATRAELLAVLADGLSPADQDFLLVTLGDRSRAVTAVALDLLTRLPGSPLRQHMRVLAARHLTVGRRLRRPTVTLTHPTRAELHPWPLPAGDPWPLLMSRVDPAEWPQVFGTDLLELVAAGIEELQPLWSGFRPAAITFRHSGLARVLVTGQLAGTVPKALPTIDPALWRVLTPADATDLLDRMLADRRVRPDQVGAAVTAVRRPWPRPFARRFAAWLPAAGSAATPAPRSLWELWAGAVALPDCRELAGLARDIAARATGDQASTLITRAGGAAQLLTLRAVLDETLCPPGGTP